MPTAHRIIIRSSRNLARELFEGLSLRFGDEQGREDTAQHEQCEYLHDVVEPGGSVRAWWRALGSERTEDDLGNDGADFA